MGRNNESNIVVAEDVIVDKIYYIRGQKVMLDRDLAAMYGVETKQLKRAVRRHIDRFPGDFMFVLTKKELEDWRCQIGTSNSGDKMGLRYPPMAFTEQGVAMLSSVLNSETAINVNIQVIRIFSRMRTLLTAHKDILEKLDQLEKKVQDNSKDIQVIFGALKKLLAVENKREKIGFKTKGGQ